MKHLIAFAGFLLVLGSCSEITTEDKIVSGFSSLNGNNFVMKVDRVTGSPSVQFPADGLKETDYIVYNGEKNYTISFSKDGQTVTIEPGAIGGRKANSSAQNVRYEFTDGVFAGGRFVVWIDDKKFESELTIYGSGLPIILSERGSLSQK